MWVKYTVTDSHYQIYGNREWPDVISEGVFPYFIFKKANVKIIVNISAAKKPANIKFKKLKSLY